MVLIGTQKRLEVIAKDDIDILFVVHVSYT